MSRERQVFTPPDHHLTRRKLFTLAATAVVHQLLASKSSAMLSSPEGGPLQATKAPVALMYHDINFPRPGNSVEEANWVPPKRFRTQIEQVEKSKFRFSTLSEALDNPGERVALTFDDAIHTAYDFIFPFLDSIGARSTFFVPVEFLHKSSYYMTEKQVKELSDAGFEIGSHSFHHIPLTTFDSPRKVKEELKTSKGYLEDLIGKEVSLFAYPYGKHNASIAEAVFNAGYRAAFLSRRNTGLRLPPPFDRFELPRYWIVQQTDLSNEIFNTQRRGNYLQGARKNLI